MSAISIEQVRPELTWRLRQKVLYPNEKFYNMEMEEDADGIHFAAFKDNELAAVVSLFQKENDFQFRKFAVEPAWQHQGVGSALLTYITGFAAQQGGTRLWCNARLTALGFYLKQGFSHTGNFFTRYGFDYEMLEKPLV